MSNTKLLIIAGVLIVLVLVLVVFLILGGGSQTKEANLEFWGVFDDATAYRDVIRDFQRLNPEIKVTYRKISIENYESEVVNALAQGTGPDIWLIHNTWLPKHKAKLFPLPQNNKDLNYKIADFQNDFVDVALDDLTDNGEIYALPIYVDTLGLFYNRDLLNSNGVALPPSTWDEFNEAVKAITRVGEFGEVLVSGAAMGTAGNINRAVDIVYALMIQSGVEMTDQDRTSATFARPQAGQPVGETALQYYTDFSNSNKEVYSWNNDTHYSIDAFYEGSTAMMLNYSHHIQTILSKAPRLNFGTAPLPQISGSNVDLSFASYWVPAVTLGSEAPEAAWKFLTYLSSKEGAGVYLAQIQRPAARRDLVDVQRDDPNLGPFALQALSARSWHQIDPGSIEKIFIEMIEDVNFGRSSTREALQNAEDRVNVLMQR